MDDGDTLLDLLGFLSNQADAISRWDEWLDIGSDVIVDDEVAQEKRLFRILGEMEAMTNEFLEKIAQIDSWKHPLAKEARDEMDDVCWSLSDAHFLVKGLIELPRERTTGNRAVFPESSKAYQLLRHKCGRLANYYLRPLEDLAGKIRFALDLGESEKACDDIPARDAQSINTEHHKHQAKLARREAVRSKVIQILQERWDEAHGRFGTPRPSRIVDIMFLEPEYQPDWPEGTALSIESRTLRDDISAILKEIDVEKFRPTD